MHFFRKSIQEGIHTVVLYLFVHMKRNRNTSCVTNEKSSRERSLNSAYFLTSAHLVLMSNCYFGKLQKLLDAPVQTSALLLEYTSAK